MSLDYFCFEMYKYIQKVPQFSLIWRKINKVYNTFQIVNKSDFDFAESFGDQN